MTPRLDFLRHPIEPLPDLGRRVAVLGNRSSVFEDFAALEVDEALLWGHDAMLVLATRKAIDKIKRGCELSNR